MERGRGAGVRLEDAQRKKERESCVEDILETMDLQDRYGEG